MLSHSQRQDSSSSSSSTSTSSTPHIPIPGGGGLPKSAAHLQFLQDQALAKEREAAFAARLIQGLSLSMMQHSSSPWFCDQTQDCVNHILQSRQQRDYVYQVTNQVLAELDTNDDSKEENDDEHDDDDVMFALDF